MTPSQRQQEADTLYTYYELQSNLILCWQVIIMFGLSRFFLEINWKIVQTRELPIRYMQNWELLNANKKQTHYHELQSNLILLTSDYEFWTFTIFWEIDLKIVQTRELHTDSIHKSMQNWEPLNANVKHTHHHQAECKVIWFSVDKWFMRILLPFYISTVFHEVLWCKHGLIKLESELKVYVCLQS